MVLRDSRMVSCVMRNDALRRLQIAHDIEKRCSVDDRDFRIPLRLLVVLMYLDQILRCTPLLTHQHEESLDN